MAKLSGCECPLASDVLCTSIGLNTVAALLDAAASEGGALSGRYAASLLLRLLTSSRGPSISETRAAMLSQVLKRASGAADEELVELVRACEVEIQPTLVLQQHGLQVLADAVAVLVQEGRCSELLDWHGDASPEQTDETLLACFLKHEATLSASLQLLRSATAHKRAALILYEGNALSWLQRLLEGCMSALDIHHDAHCGVRTRTPGTNERLHWLLEAVVSTLYHVLWHISESELEVFVMPGLVEALCRCWMLLARCPAVSLLSLSSSPPAAPYSGTRRALPALGEALLRVLGLFVEGKWTSAFPQLLETARSAPSDGVGAVVLLSLLMPPPLPLGFEELPRAAVPLPPPTLLLLPPGIATNLAVVARVLAARDACTDGEGDPNASIQGLGWPLEGEPAELALCSKLAARRQCWRRLLSAQIDSLQELLKMLAKSSCQKVMQGLMAFLPSLVDLLTGPQVQDCALKPLLQVQVALGQALSACSAQNGAQRDDDHCSALARNTLLLATIASQPSGRAALLLEQPDTLLEAVLPPLSGGHGVSALAALSLLNNLFSPPQSAGMHSLAMPPITFLEPVSAALLKLCDSDLVLEDGTKTASLQAQARTLRALLERRLSEPLPSGHEAGSESADRAHAENEPDMECIVCPPAWRVAGGHVHSVLRTGNLSGIFGRGLVPTELAYGLSASKAAGVASEQSSKRQRIGVGSLEAEAPPPVRSGRGRVRDENPMQRGKPNTSRPASKHVDDFTGSVGPKRFQNSSRAPSKHVDDYQAAPVVRKTVPAETSCIGSLSGANCTSECDGSGHCDSATASSNERVSPLGGSGGATAAGPRGACFNHEAANTGMSTNIQKLQQQLGLAAAQGMWGGGNSADVPPMREGAGAQVGRAMESEPEKSASSVGEAQTVISKEGPGGAHAISKEDLQMLMQDECKLQRFLEQNPSMMQELMRMS